MKRLFTAATVAFACLFATPSRAVIPMQLTGHSGQVLLFPYFTANRENISEFTISSDAAQATRVRFREGDNSRTVFQFNLYLAAGATWTGAVFALDDQGPANILADATACTVPNLRAADLPRTPNGRQYRPFSSAAYSGANADGGRTDELRTRTGFVEVIAMGTLTDGGQPTSVIEEIGRGNSSASPDLGEPNDCGAVEQLWAPGGAWDEASGGDRTSGIFPPLPITGSETILNVAGGTRFTVLPTGIGNFYTGTPLGGLHYPPGDDHPNLTDADNGGEVMTTATPGPNGATVYSSWYPHSADAVSALLMASTLSGYFEAREPLRGRSEWVLSFPTQSFYGPTNQGTMSPFAADRVDGRTCEVLPIDAASYDALRSDRRGGSIDEVPDACHLTTQFCPPRFPNCQFVPAGCRTVNQVCGSTATIGFNQPGIAAGAPSTIFGAVGGVSRTFRNGGVFERGRATVNLGVTTFDEGRQRRLRSFEGNLFSGLPVIGVAVQVISNDHAREGQRADYTSSEELARQ